jgi:hypothetical protein
MSSNDVTRGITTARVAIGGSLCIGFTAGAGCNGYMLSFISGGTCSLVGTSTMSTGYLLSAGNQVPIAGPAPFYINELAGVTAIVQLIRTLT